MTTEIMETISSLTIEKMNLENAILIVDSAETRAKAIISEFNKLPNKIESFDDFDYKNLYSRAYVKSKDDILIIVGNKDVSKLKLSTTGELQVEVPYTVRITTLHLKLSVYVNIWWFRKRQKHPAELLGFIVALVQVPPIKGVA